MYPNFRFPCSSLCIAVLVPGRAKVRTVSRQKKATIASAGEHGHFCASHGASDWGCKTIKTATKQPWLIMDSSI